MDNLNHPDSNRRDESDELIRQWAGSHMFSKGDLQRMSAAICRQADLPTVQPPSPVRKFALRSALALAAAAAMIGVVCSLQFNLPASDDLLLARQATVPIERLRILARESGRLFDHRVSWLAETNQDLLLGLDGEPSSPADKQPQITLRVVVFHRTSSDQDWKPVFTTNVVTREEEVVELNSLAAGPKLRLWTHILPDQTVAVDTQLTLQDSASHAWSTTSVLSSAAPTAVLKDYDERGEYQLWQSATIIAEGDL